MSVYCWTEDVQYCVHKSRPIRPIGAEMQIYTYSRSARPMEWVYYILYSRIYIEIVEHYANVCSSLLGIILHEYSRMFRARYYCVLWRHAILGMYVPIQVAWMPTQACWRMMHDCVGPALVRLPVFPSQLFNAVSSSLRGMICLLRDTSTSSSAFGFFSWIDP